MKLNVASNDGQLWWNNIPLRIEGKWDYRIIERCRDALMCAQLMNGAVR